MFLFIHRYTRLKSLLFIFESFTALPPLDGEKQPDLQGRRAAPVVTRSVRPVLSWILFFFRLVLIARLQLIKATWWWWEGHLEKPEVAAFSSYLLMRCGQAARRHTTARRAFDSDPVSLGQAGFKPDQAARLILSPTCLWKRWHSIESAASLMLRSRHAAGEAVLSHGFADLCVFLPADPPQPPLTGSGDITVKVCLSPGHKPFLADTGNTPVHDSAWYSEAVGANAQTASPWLRQRLQSSDENEMRMILMWLWNQPGYRLSREDAADAGGLFSVMSEVKYRPKRWQRL